DAGMADVDVIMMLRIQKERMATAQVPDADRYFAKYGLSTERLAKARPDAIVMHPQPMNRGIEIASDVADGPQSVIRDQVRNGVAVRMAVLEAVIEGRSHECPAPGRTRPQPRRSPCASRQHLRRRWRGDLAGELARRTVRAAHLGAEMRLARRTRELR